MNMCVYTPVYVHILHVSSKFMHDLCYIICMLGIDDDMAAVTSWCSYDDFGD